LSDTDVWGEFKQWLPGAKIKAVHIRNFRGIVDLKITDWDERGTLFLIGPNGSGKSTVLNAIRWVLGDLEEEVSHLGRKEGGKAIIAVYTHETQEERGTSDSRETEVKLSLIKGDSAGTLWRTKSVWKCEFGKDDEKITIDEIEKDKIRASIQLLYLSPTEGVVSAPDRVRRIIAEYFKTLFILGRGGNDRRINPKIDIEVETKNQFKSAYDELKEETETLLEAFERAVTDVSGNLGSQLYKPDFALRSDDAEKSLNSYFKPKPASVEEILVSLVSNHMGVTVQPVVEVRSGANPGKQAEKGHSAGTLQSLALLNLYGWLEAVRAYYNSESEKKVAMPLFLLLLEEPEVFLHPQWARVFSDSLASLGVLAQKSGDKKENTIPVQSLVTTHSPIFARVDRHKQLQIHRLESAADNRYRVYAYSEQDQASKAIADRLNDIAQFNPAVNELFFAKRVVLVEGPTEAWLFPRFAYWLWNWKQANAEKDPTYNTTLVPCGPTKMKELFGILARLGVQSVVIHDLDPLKQKGGTTTDDEGSSSDESKDSKSGIIGRNRGIESIIQYYGNTTTQLRRLNPDLEGVLGYHAKGGKPYRALLFLSWLFTEEPTGRVMRTDLLSLIDDWQDDSREGCDGWREYNEAHFSPIVTRGTGNNPTVGSNFLYLLDVITEIYTPPGDEKTREIWQARKKSFINHLRQRGILTIAGQIIKSPRINVKK